MGIASPITSMALAVDAAELARLEAAATDDPASTVTLAWHLRQRDTVRALALADAAEAALPDDAQILRARLLLVRAEAAWLRADLVTATDHSHLAHAAMQRCGDHAGLADAHIVQAMIAYERGQRELGEQGLKASQTQADQAGDSSRARLAQAIWAFKMGFGDVDEAEQQWGGLMTDLQTCGDSVLAMWAWDYRAQIEYRRGRFAQAIAAREESFHHALAAGQTRRAIFACLNTGAHYHDLNDDSAALRWIERGMQLARPTGWPSVNGGGLMLLGRVLTDVGRLDDARQALDDAKRLLLPLQGSTTALLAVFHASILERRAGNSDRAVAGLRQFVALSESDELPDMVLKGQLELALALSEAGQHAQARVTAEQALQMAQADRSVVAEIDALFTLADVHAAMDSTATPPGPGTEPGACLRLLLRALELSGSVPDFVTAASTWDKLAAEHARAGDYAQAYAMARKAGLARDEARKQQVSNHAVAIAAQLESERQRLEREQLREQAARSAERARLLQATHATLEQLGRIGREVTAMLDFDTVWDSIHSRLRALMDVPHLSLWLLDEATHTLCMRLGIEDGRQLPPARVALQSAGSKLARCLREDREIEHASPPAAADHSHPPRKARMHNGLFGPLRVRGRVIGVMSVQSRRANAYGERERLVFRTVCAYGAIALDNAAVYAELSRARIQLQHASEAETQARRRAEHAASQKNAFLARTSDALRTPLGALHEALSTLLQPALQTDDARRRQCLDAALAQSRQVNVLARELLELARLESGAAQPLLEPFSLADLTQDVLLKFEALAAERQQHLSSHVAATLPDVLADIGMIERVLSTLIDLALCRQPVPEGVEVHLRPTGDTVRLILATVGALPSALPSEGAAEGDVGLAIARQMLLLHGHVLAQGAGGMAGSRFEFSLPQVPG
jgi:tetratricopeptide (TPR) repeat protein